MHYRRLSVGLALLYLSPGPWNPSFLPSSTSSAVHCSCWSCSCLPCTGYPYYLQYIRLSTAFRGTALYRHTHTNSIRHWIAQQLYSTGTLWLEFRPDDKGQKQQHTLTQSWWCVGVAYVPPLYSVPRLKWEKFTLLSRVALSTEIQFWGLLVLLLVLLSSMVQVVCNRTAVALGWPWVGWCDVFVIVLVVVVVLGSSSIFSVYFSMVVWRRVLSGTITANHHCTHRTG